MDSYNNSEIRMQSGGRKIVRNVSIKNNKGYKSVTKYHKGKKVGTSKKRLTRSEMSMIKMKKFIPRLFNNCKCNKFSKTKKCNH